MRGPASVGRRVIVKHLISWALNVLRHYRLLLGVLDIGCELGEF